MKKMMIAWIFLAAGLFGTLYFIGVNYTKSFSAYRELEADMIESAHIYLEVNDISLDFNETLKIKAEKMVESNTLSELSVKDDTCDGYVIVKRTIKEYVYTPYIKCSEYTTIDYE